MGDKGYVVEPTIFADVKDDMDIAKYEMSLYGMETRTLTATPAYPDVHVLEALRLPSQVRDLRAGTQHSIGWSHHCFELTTLYI